MRHGRPGGTYGTRGDVAPPPLLNFAEIENLLLVSLMFFEASYITVPPKIVLSPTLFENVPPGLQTTLGVRLGYDGTAGASTGNQA